MAIEILEDKNGYKAMYCNTTMWAFGPIFYEDDDVEDFLEWLPNDARTYSDKDLENLLSKWRATLSD